MNILIIGAHPDDCEYRCAGSAAKWAAAGHDVKFLTATNGDAGHHELSGEALARRRAVEAQNGATRLGVQACEALPNHDGSILATLELRNDMIRQIRAWKADVVITHRPNDYHADHRYTSVAVQDAAYLVMVPNLCPEVPVLRRNPVFVYMQDEFEKPTPFSADVVVAIDDVWEAKVESLAAHESQFFEWLPWVDGAPASMPSSREDRLRVLARWLDRPLPDSVVAAIAIRYGGEAARSIAHAEAYELCEYGRQPTPAELDEMFPR
jgi:LmbE family N-acetylglucosaminyl deacetylase